MPGRVALSVEPVETPLGAILLLADGEGFLRAAEFSDCEARLHTLLARRLGRAGYTLAPGSVPAVIRTALAHYFAGDLAALAPIPVAAGGTAFQAAVWSALRTIAPGQRLSYGQLAEVLGRPGSSRAVGHANGANPVSIIVPCHRLVGANGALTGYGGGIERKRWLLDHEARHAGGQPIGI
jgi:methylated-DNA-[protein]-cysteine S-methyltransferase